MDDLSNFREIEIEHFISRGIIPPTEQYLRENNARPEVINRLRERGVLTADPNIQNELRQRREDELRETRERERQERELQQLRSAIRNEEITYAELNVDQLQYFIQRGDIPANEQYLRDLEDIRISYLTTLIERGILPPRPPLIEVRVPNNNIGMGTNENRTVTVFYFPESDPPLPPLYPNE